MSKESKLIKRLKDRKEQQETTKNLKKYFKQRQEAIDKAEDKKRTDFFCRNCKTEFDALGRKVISTYRGMRASYHATCKCGSDCERYITDEQNDPYYFLSPKLNKLRQQYEIDLLQPDDPRFKTYYGDPREETWKAMEEAEKDGHRRGLGKKIYKTY